jgi:hypothetical protein
MHALKGLLTGFTIDARTMNHGLAAGEGFSQSCGVA